MRSVGRSVGRSVNTEHLLCARPFPGHWVSDAGASSRPVLVEPQVRRDVKFRSKPIVFRLRTVRIKGSPRPFLPPALLTEPSLPPPLLPSRRCLRLLSSAPRPPSSTTCFLSLGRALAHFCYLCNFLNKHSYHLKNKGGGLEDGVLEQRAG